MDHVFILNYLIQRQLLQCRKLYACFVDLSQAFDTPEHNLLWCVLIEMGVSKKVVRLLAFIYRIAKAQIITSNGLTDHINIMKGVLQGETASPSLFNLFIDGIVERLEKSNIHGFKLITIIVHILLYADDMSIVAAYKETLQMKINVAAKFLRERGFNINIDKTKVVVFKKSGRRTKLDTFNWKGEDIEVE